MLLLVAAEANKGRWKENLSGKKGGNVSFDLPGFFVLIYEVRLPQYSFQCW